MSTLLQQKQLVPSLPISLFQTKEIRMEVVFGTPSQNCIGSGICMVMNRLPPNLRCPNAPVWVSYENGMLAFRFLKSEMLREDAQSRFESPWFFVEESFQLPRYTARRLGMTTHWVSPGLYPIGDTAKDWVLAFHPLDRKAQKSIQ